MTKKKQPYRAVRVEFDYELWDRTQKVAEYDDRYLKTLVTEILRAGINERYNEIRNEVMKEKVDELATEANLLAVINGGTA